MVGLSQSAIYQVTCAEHLLVSDIGYIRRCRAESVFMILYIALICTGQQTGDKPLDIC